MMKEHDHIALTEALPDAGLHAGDVGVIVHIYPGGKAFEVEFVTYEGTTIAVTTVEAHQARPVTAQDLPHIRRIPA